ncbi:tryptophan--tRNA ligase, partial [Candidatus Micrarchaeota archaeon]|nr:tryptophan--tRNA ligase [Candidatus Micrarchaeota archaeon]
MAEEFTVTPWDVSGEVDYDKLIKKFGTKRIDARLRERIGKDSGELNYMLRRDYFFSHRDLDLALDDYE